MPENPRILKGGQFTLDHRMDRVREVDIRTLNYPVSAVLAETELANPRSYSWYIDERLDQGQEGACVGFGWAAELAARPIEVAGITDSFARMNIYKPAQFIDEWPGEAYEGTSVLAGAKILQSLGYISEYRWALTMQDLVVALGYLGPAVIGVEWYQGMTNVDAAGYIRPTGSIVGGHCVAICGVRIVRKNTLLPVTWDNVDMLRSFFRIQNSWGRGWGRDGRCLLSFIDMMKLWPSGDFCIPLGRKAGNPIGHSEDQGGTVTSQKIQDSTITSAALAGSR